MADPTFIEGDVFKTIILLIEQATEQAEQATEQADQASAQASDQVTDQADEDIKRLLEFCKTPRSREEMHNQSFGKRWAIKIDYSR